MLQVVLVESTFVEQALRLRVQLREVDGGVRVQTCRRVLAQRNDAKSHLWHEFFPHGVQLLEMRYEVLNHMEGTLKEQKLHDVADVTARQVV